jgi:hypothetical protein
MQWKRHTFHLIDAYFGGRENGAADLRLSDGGWFDGQANYFGRIWVAKFAPANQAPDLAVQPNVAVKPGQVVEVAVSATDPDGNAISLALDRGAPFASLTDHGNGAGTLRLAPAASDAGPCSPYAVRVLATDSGSAALLDAATVEVFVAEHALFLPVALK